MVHETRGIGFPHLAPGTGSHRPTVHPEPRQAEAAGVPQIDPTDRVESVKADDARLMSPPVAAVENRGEASPAAGRYSLPPQEAKARARWVHATFREANAEVAKQNPAGLEEKTGKMSLNPFSFYRGAATLFYLDLASHAPPLPDEPRVRLDGDVHPENFGTYTSARGHLLYDLNDFDETVEKGPFSWDVRRGATGWLLAAQGAGHSENHQVSVAQAFVDGFVEELRACAEHGGAGRFHVDLDHSEGPVHDLLKKQSDVDPRNVIADMTEKTADGQHRFARSSRLVPHPEHKPVLESALSFLGPQHIDDVAGRLDSGTASLGLPRDWVLEDAGTGHRRDDHVVEVKQELRSALDGVPYIETSHPVDRGSQVAEAARLMPAEPYPELGSFVIAPEALGAIRPPGGAPASFMVRQRPALKAAVAELDLHASDQRSVARTQGRLLAAEMARQPGPDGQGTAATALVAFLDQHPGFAQNLLDEAVQSATRVNQDYHAFCHPA